MDTTYYRSFQIVTRFPLWRGYLRWAYSQCIKDLMALNYSPDFTRKNFTCLLCGVSGEVTANEFISFVLRRNSNANIIIIDYGKPQIEAIEKLVKRKYHNANIQVRRANALNLSFIAPHSVDWIETDGFLEYFDITNLDKLLDEWKRIVKKDGFITVREFASGSAAGNIIDSFRLWIARVYLDVALFRHTRKTLERHVKRHGFSFVIGWTPIPTFRRYVMVNE